MPPRRLLIPGLLCLLLGACMPPPPEEPPIEERSYHVGSIAAMAEMVQAGVRPMAFGPPLERRQMDKLFQTAKRIAHDHGVQIFRETDFLVTALFSIKVTRFKEVLILYRGDALRRYEALKKRKRMLEAGGRYAGTARERLARDLGHLLAYSDAYIDQLIRANPPRDW